MGSLSEIVGWIRTQPKKRLIIGIDGFGGSGKSTLADRIGDEVLLAEVATYDDLYLPESIRPNFLASSVGIADAYDWEALRDGVLEPFRKGDPCRYPVLDWETQEREMMGVSPHTRILIVEGVSCTRPELRDFYDFRVWVTAPNEVRLARGIARDGEDMRGYWRDVWMPAEQIYFRSCHPDQKVDLIVDGTR